MWALDVVSLKSIIIYGVKINLSHQNRGLQEKCVAVIPGAVENDMLKTIYHVNEINMRMEPTSAN